MVLLAVSLILKRKKKNNRKYIKHEKNKAQKKHNTRKGKSSRVKLSAYKVWARMIFSCFLCSCVCVFYFSFLTKRNETVIFVSVEGAKKKVFELKVNKFNEERVVLFSTRKKKEGKRLLFAK